MSYRKYDNKIEFLDNRFYLREDGGYSPSVTTVLNAYPVGVQLLDWMKSTGFNSDIIKKNAALIGTIVHEAIEKLLLGMSVDFDKDIEMRIPEHLRYEAVTAWEMVLKAEEFFTSHEFTDIKAEANYVSKKYDIGGTVDFIGKYKGETWVIDFKTSNYLHDTYNLQLSAYKKMAEEAGIKIDRVGILHLKAKTRTVKEFQGIGWQLKEIKNIEDRWSEFEAVRKVYDIKFKSLKPRIKTFKTKVNLGKKLTNNK